MPGLQDRQVSPYRSTHGRGTCPLAGARDHKHFMTPMTTPSAKSLPDVSALVQATGKPRLESVSWRFSQASPGSQQPDRTSSEDEERYFRSPFPLSSSPFLRACEIRTAI